MTTTDVLRQLAKDDGNYIARDLTTDLPRLVMRDSNGDEICTVPDELFDVLREHWYLECVNGKWRLNDAGNAAAR